MKEVNLKGSALVFVLIIMFIVLTAALGVASVSVIDQKSSSATGKSTQAFQVADSAVELILKKAVTDPVGTTFASLGACNSATGAVDVSSLLSLPANSVSALFSDSNGVVLSCAAAEYNLSQVAEVKAVAQYGSTTRAISAAVAAGTLTWNALPLSGGWANYGSGWRNAEYAKDSRTGIVHLRGLVKPTSSVAANNMTISEISATLESDFQPAARQIFAASCNGGVGPTYPISTCRVDVSPTVGTVGLILAPVQILTTGYLSLDGIAYPTN